MKFKCRNCKKVHTEKEPSLWATHTPGVWIAVCKACDNLSKYGPSGKNPYTVARYLKNRISLAAANYPPPAGFEPDKPMIVENMIEE